MRFPLIVFAFLCFAVRLHAQQDYFYAETLIDNGQHAEAVRVLDHLIDSGAYADRPRFQMMTLNLAGTTKLYLKDTAGGKKCFEAAMKCYDTLSGPRKGDDWNHREYYKAGEHLAELCYTQRDYKRAGELMSLIGRPGQYYSATGHDVLVAENGYFSLRIKIFQKLDQPDSAFACMRRMRDHENRAVRFLDSIFDVSTNNLASVECVLFQQTSIDGKEKAAGCLYFAAWTDNTHTQHSIWFINPEHAPVAIIGESTYNQQNDQGFPANCYTMSLSPDEKYLAVECYTEGNNCIEVISFPEVIAQKKCIVKHELQAYPASIIIKGWQRSLLWLECEADLTKLNKKDRLLYIDYPKDDAVPQQYLFDPENKKYSKK